MSRDLALQKAAVLVDALPWLERFHGKVVVIKYGGSAMSSPELQRAFAEDVVFLRYAGLRPVVVHGGGPQITEHLGRLGIPSEFRGGLRVTTPEAMSVVRMVLVGQVNGEIVNLINEHGPFAVGPVRRGRRAAERAAQPRRSSTAQRSTSARSATSSAVDPAPCGHCSTPAGSRLSPRWLAAPTGCPTTSTPTPRQRRIAVSLGAEKLIVLTDVDGLYADWPRQRRGRQHDRRPAAAGAAADSGQRHGAEDAGMPSGRRGRRPRRARARRPGAARPAAGDLHHRGIGTMVLPTEGER